MNQLNQESSNGVKDIILKLYNCTLECLDFYKETFDVAYTLII